MKEHKADRKLYRAVGARDLKRTTLFCASASQAGLGKALLEAIDRKASPEVLQIAACLMQRKIPANFYALAVKIAQRRHWPGEFVDLLATGADLEAQFSGEVYKIAAQAQAVAIRETNDRDLRQSAEDNILTCDDDCDEYYYDRNYHDRHVCSKYASLKARGEISERARGQTLVVALQKGLERTAATLLRDGIGADMQDAALIAAASPGLINIDALRALLAKGGTSIEAHGQTLKSIAAWRPEREQEFYSNIVTGLGLMTMMTDLLDKGVSPAARDDALVVLVSGHGKDAWFADAFLRETVKKILNVGTSEAARDRALITLAETSCVKIAHLTSLVTSLVLKAGVSQEAKNKALLHAVNRVNAKIMVEILKDGIASLAVRDSALLAAAKREFPAGIESLLDKGVSPKAASGALIALVSARNCNDPRLLVQKILAGETTLEGRDEALRIVLGRARWPSRANPVFRDIAGMLRAAGADIDRKPPAPPQTGPLPAQPAPKKAGKWLGRFGPF